MTPKLKKNKQQFEHLVYSAKRTDGWLILYDFQSEGWELVALLPDLKNIKFATLFFKRPV